MKRIEGAPARKMDDEIPFIQQAGSQSDGGWTASMKSRESHNAMNTKTAGYLMLYGAFLLVMGLLGYLSNPEKAKRR